MNPAVLLDAVSALLDLGLRYRPIRVAVWGALDLLVPFAGDRALRCALFVLASGSSPEAETWRARLTELETWRAQRSVLASSEVSSTGTAPVASPALPLVEGTSERMPIANCERRTP